MEREIYSQCWRLDQMDDGSGGSGEWQWIKADPLTEPYRAGGSTINEDGDWWAIPGYSNVTTLYDRSSGQWGPGPDLFIKESLRNDFCVAQLNSTHTFVGGGDYQAEFSNDAYMFDWPNQEWTQVGRQ